MSLLLSPLITGHMELKNRLVFPSVGTSTPDEDGKVTTATLDFFRERTKGFGLVILEHSYVSISGKAAPHMLSISDDSDIDGLNRLAELLHGNGCQAHIQLDHGGGWTIPALQGCLDPSKNREGRFLTDVLSDDNLEEIIADFASAAVRAKRAGFDGVQIKACHVYLLSQFYSPLTNHRTGGRYAGTSFESRIRLTLDVLCAVRNAVGADYPVSVRFPVQDYDPAGSTLEEGIRAARLIQDNGASFLDLSGGPKHRYFHPFIQTPGWFGHDARLIRQELSIPVMVTGGIVAPGDAETLLAEEKADLVGVCRAALKNPGWAQDAIKYVGKVGGTL